MSRPKKGRNSGEAFADLLKKHGLTPYELAKRTELDKSSISRIVNGITGSPNLNTLQAIANVMKIDLVELTKIFDSSSENKTDISCGNKGSQSNKAQFRRDWEGIPDMYTDVDNRDTELSTLEDWITNKQCRLVTITGITGVGKSFLAAKLATQIQKKFKYLVWCNLTNSTPLINVVGDFQKVLSQEGLDEKLTVSNDYISYLINCLSQYPYLLVLDGVENIFDENKLAGSYRKGYESYGELFKRVGEASHQSCMIVISREKPKEVALLEKKPIPVKSLLLKGLQQNAALQILIDKGFSGKEQGLTELIKFSDSNPLALNLVAEVIHEVFGGNVIKYLENSTMFSGDFSHLLSQTFNRLSTLETEIIYWLAILENPISFSQLKALFQETRYSEDLAEAIKSLMRRSLLETRANSATYTLQSAVMHYSFKRFASQLIQGLVKVAKTQQTSDLGLVKSYNLLLVANQARLLKFIVRELSHICQQDRIEEQLNLLQTILETKSDFIVGYSRKNIQYLLSHLATLTDVN